MKVTEAHHLGVFSEKLVKQSENKQYQYARNEWVPIKYWEVQSPVKVKCLCGAPIKKVVLAKNIFNGNEEFVGVSCLNELVVNINGKRAEQDYQRLAKNHGNIPNPAIVIYAYLEDVLTFKEYHFLIDMSRKEWETLTLIQRHWLTQLNKKMISRIQRSDFEKVFWPQYTVYN